MSSRTSANVSIFALFFGVTMLDAFRDGRWLHAVFWVAIGIAFVGVNLLPHRR